MACLMESIAFSDTKVAFCPKLDLYPPVVASKFSNGNASETMVLDIFLVVLCQLVGITLFDPAMVPLHGTYIGVPMSFKTFKTPPICVCMIL